MSGASVGSTREACLLTPIPSEPSEDPDAVAVPAVPGLAAAAAALLAVPEPGKQPPAIRDTPRLDRDLGSRLQAHPESDTPRHRHAQQRHRPPAARQRQEADSRQRGQPWVHSQKEVLGRRSKWGLNRNN
jgi:hypothetical protein